MEHCKKLVAAHFGEFGQGTLEQRVKSVPPFFFSFLLEFLLAREREFVHFSRAELVRVVSSTCTPVPPLPGTLLPETELTIVLPEQSSKNT